MSQQVRWRTESVALLLAVGIAVGAVGQVQSPPLTLVPVDLPYVQSGSELDDGDAVVSGTIRLQDHCQPCGASLLHNEQYVVWVPHGATRLSIIAEPASRGGMLVEMFVRAGVPVGEDAGYIYCTHTAQRSDEESRLEIGLDSYPALTSGFYYVAVAGETGFDVEFRIRGAIAFERLPSSAHDLDPYLPLAETDVSTAPDDAFVVAIPANWSLRSFEESGENAVVAVYGPEACSDKVFCPEIEIARFPLSNVGGSLDDAFDAMLGTLQSNGFSPVAYRGVELDGVPGQGAWLQRMLPWPTNLQFVALIQGDKLWVLQIVFPMTPLATQYADAFDRVLNSWRP